MPDIIIQNACIITCDGNKVIPDGAIHIKDGKILMVNQSSAVSSQPSATSVADDRRPTTLQTGDQRPTTINASGRIVMPGLINPHMHLYSQFARGLAVPRVRSFTEILESLWWRLDRVLTKDDIYFSALIGIIEAIKSGVTTLIDHHASYGCVNGSLRVLQKAFEKIGMRGVLCYEVSDRAGAEKCEEAIEENVSPSPLVPCPPCSSGGGEGGLIRSMFGLHASLTLSSATLKKVRDANKNLPYHIHVAEGPEDLADSKAKYGKSVVRRLYDEGILTKGSIAAHCVQVSDEDIALLKKSGAFVVHNPLSNLNNAVGTAPYLKMCSADVPVGIGTDGMSSGILADVKMASVLHKITAGDPQAGWAEVQNSALKINAQIASSLFGQKIGVIKPGAAADIIIVDSIPFTEVTGENYWGHVLFGLCNSRVHTTIVNGRVLMENFKLVDIEEEKIVKAAKKLSAEVWKRCYEKY